MPFEHDFATETINGVTVGNTSTEIVSDRSDRKALCLTNDSTQNIYIGLGVAAVLNKGRRLNARGGVFTDNGSKPFRGAIYGICASGGANICVADA